MDTIRREVDKVDALLISSGNSDVRDDFPRNPTFSEVEVDALLISSGNSDVRDDFPRNPTFSEVEVCFSEHAFTLPSQICSRVHVCCRSIVVNARGRCLYGFIENVDCSFHIRSNHVVSGVAEW
ncbi:unnamed protein product [Cylicostephanus goldi]|uniref:Uncharacterized protein n=1 Tax=Cylicostephanus goldi TaxID=71465 RepID=A0A3P7R0V7_CYLGO|nr:unnamed protein product [Cylicostephanus goldi]